MLFRSMYAKNFKSLEKERCNSIMFMGQVGAGKSHLSLAIANELMEDGVGVVYMSYREVITRLKQNIMDEVYYHLYLLYSRRGDKPKASLYLDSLKQNYSDSKWTILLTDPCKVLLDQAHVLVSPGTPFGVSAAGHFRIACTVGIDQLKTAFDRMEKLSF